ncbi:ankyrin repeat domain-containing protein [Streptomyces sp. ISL-96]|uniref:ankyrin repeat domain-containing protein n=1 Tax=Streptomyces sp. ISL-96 TaxID=2819191 RepID=UPI001BE7346A|nr:ankyrin repeat domain-containing protein [Streptomyces sp. ISL-96]MBT2486978.1 ankyrin repeat domain-containing protein [Streptomyces sp. ISL-96]
MTNDPAADSQALFEALYDEGDDAVVRLLRSGVPAEATDDGETALYRASVQDHPGMVRLLLAAGADPDRASGPQAGDLPLCGAAVGGHTEVVEALLSAGATPDLREEFGFTAMAWAVRQGHADVVEALLEYGADPDLPAPGTEPPLVLAARRGSTETVRTLLRHGASARREALEEARRWLEADVEEELRAGLLETFGDAAAGAAGAAAETEPETVTSRFVEDGGETVVVELLRDGRPSAGNEQQTGHAAIATLLEERLGIRTPFEELAERALSSGDPGRDEWMESVAALWRRGDEETFQAAAAWCASGDPLRQAFAADVLAQLGFEQGGKPFAARALPLLRELVRTAGDGDSELAQAAVLALGHHGDPSALPEILRHVGHPDAEVRHRVALSLIGLVPAGHREGATALITLSRDPDDEVRDWATLALAGLDADTPEIREALADRLEDHDPDTAAEAARGLAARGDDRAVEALARLLREEDPQGYAYATAVEALEYVEDAAVRRRLERTPPRYR